MMYGITDLTDALVEHYGKQGITVTKKAAKQQIIDVFDTIHGVLASSESDGVSILGFGKFEKKDVAERPCRNPQTGEELIAPAHKAVRFKAGKALKESVESL